MLKVQIIGNLGGDAKVQSGGVRSFVSFNVAHTDKFKDAQGISHEDVHWVNCVVNWDCSRILPYLKTGVKVYASGNLRTRIFTDRSGNTRAGIDCVVTDLELCGGSRPESAIPAPATTQEQPKPKPNNKKSNNKQPFNDTEDPFLLAATAE